MLNSQDQTPPSERRSSRVAPPVTAAPPAAPRRPGRTEWLMMLGVAIIGGSSFAAIRIAVETAPAPIVSAGRLWIAFAFMLVYTLRTGRTMMPLKTGGGLSPAWGYALAVGLIGYAMPHMLIPVAQQTVSSLLAGIYMAFMPIATVLLAAAFADEPLTPRKSLGFVGGTAGVLILIGPQALSNLLSADVRAQLLLLVAVTGYAVASVLMRRAPEVSARSFATGFLLSGALLATPLALASDWHSVSLSSWAAIAYLGIFPTGLTAIFIILTIKRVGAGFLSLSAYLSPVTAILLGVALFGEALALRHVLGLGAIMIGLLLAEPQSGRALSRWLLRRRSGPADR